MQKRCNGAKRNGIFSKCLQQICRYYAFLRNATTSNCPLNTKSHPAGMRICYAIFAGISLRSFRITFAAYLPTHIKSLWDFFQSLLNNLRDNLYIISLTKYVPLLHGSVHSIHEGAPRECQVECLVSSSQMRSHPQGNTCHHSQTYHLVQEHRYECR